MIRSSILGILLFLMFDSMSFTTFNILIKISKEVSDPNSPIFINNDKAFLPSTMTSFFVLKIISFSLRVNVDESHF